MGLTRDLSHRWQGVDDTDDSLVKNAEEGSES